MAGQQQLRPAMSLARMMPKSGVSMSAVTVAAIGLMVLAMAGTGSAIKCWECNSIHDPRCGDPFSNYSVALVDCDQRQDTVAHLEIEQPEGKDLPKASICRKTTQSVEGEVRVIRSCGWIENSGTLKGRDCFQRTGTKEVQILHCACTTDGCNSAPSGLTLSVVLLVLSPLLPAIMFN